MVKVKSIISWSAFGLLCLLTVLLIFEDGVVIPVWLQPAGRMHPLVLHFPIAFVFLLVLLDLFKKYLGTGVYQVASGFLINLTALFTTLAVVLGFFLYKEGYDSQVMALHKWSGVAVGYLSYILLIIPFHSVFYKVTLYFSFIVVIMAGHFGAGLTHGSDFLLEPVRQDKKVSIQDTTLFVSVIQPILTTKCHSCHNADKHKGGLDISSLAAIKNGGENGPLWIPNNPSKSAIIHRALLPVAHKEHMPPKGKEQLTELEVQLLHKWIGAGANEQLFLTDLSESDTLALLARNFIDVGNKGSDYRFSFVEQDIIEELNIPFRMVEQKSPSSPAIVATIFGRQTYKMEFLKELSAVKEQLVDLNLSYLPIKTEELEIIGSFENLEELNLNFTDITSSDLELLSPCKKLKSLSLSGTSVEFDGLDVIRQIPSLEHLYLWNTSISNSEIGDLKKRFPDVHFELGYLPEDEGKIKLTPPILASKKTIIGGTDKVVLSHKLQDVRIHYTIDGSEPDSSSEAYTEPLTFEDDIELKAVAIKEGWITSNVAVIEFYQKGLVPEGITLAFEPDMKFAGMGAHSLIDDKKGGTDIAPSAWVGFSTDHFSAMADFGEAPPRINKLVFSYGVVIRQRLAPPESIEIWAGNNKDSLTLLEKRAVEYTKDTPAKAVLFSDFSFDNLEYRYYQVNGVPRQKLPDWHTHKGKSSWLIVDQLFFY